MITAMKNTLALFTLLLVIFAGCKENDIPGDCSDEDSTQDLIVGEWQLKKTFNPWTQSTIVYGNAGPKIIHRFTADSIFVFENDTLESSAAYELTAQPTIDGDSLYYLNGNSTFVEVDCETLIIDSTPVDGPRQTLERKAF
jgi:hypothetical protein